MSEIQLEISDGDLDTIRIVVRGDLDMTTADQLTMALDAATDQIDVDLSRVDFIDSMGLRALLVAYRDGKRISLVAPSASVRNLLQIAGVDGILPIRG